MKSAIQSLDLSCILHATEDVEKVSAAVRALIGGDFTLELEELEGHFGNRISKVTLHLHGDEAAVAFAHVIARMHAELRDSVSRDIDEHVDEHSSLYLRFDKQRLVQGDLAEGHDDAIRLKVKPRAYLMHGHAREFFLSQLKVG